jgi:hypothetical protein
MGPKKPPISRENWQGHHQPSPLGTRTASSAWARREKYCHNGGITVAHHHGGLAAAGAGQRGPRSPSWPPSWFPKKAPVCRGKAAGSGGPRPLGAAMDSSGFFHSRAKYCHNGGMAFADQRRHPAAGSREPAAADEAVPVDSLASGQGAVIVVAVPLSALSEVFHLQAKATRDSDSRPLGQRCTRLLVGVPDLWPSGCRAAGASEGASAGPAYSRRPWNRGPAA